MATHRLGREVSREPAPPFVPSRILSGLERPDIGSDFPPDPFISLSEITPDIVEASPSKDSASSRFCHFLSICALLS